MALRGVDIRGRPLVNQNSKKLDADAVLNISCVTCGKILRSPHQLSCGDRICQSCLPSGTFECPKCNEEVDPQDVFLDKSCLRELQKLRIACECGWEGPLEVWESHMRGCTVMSPSDLPGQDIRRLEHHCMKLDQQVKILMQEVHELKGETNFVARVDSSGLEQDIPEKDPSPSSVVAKLSSDITHHKGLIAHLSAEVEKLAKAIPRQQALLDELNLKIEILEVKTTTGAYVWKVNEIRRRYQEAKDGKTSSLYSPPFYTSPHGYRLCLRAYLNGDGSGKGTHVSLFVVIMKGEFDDLLSWPFRHRVTLSLLNQETPTEPRTSKTQRFIPNPESSSFRKPKDAFNVASGFPEFVPSSVLHDPAFVKNDVLYIKVKLDSQTTSDITGPDQVTY